MTDIDTLSTLAAVVRGTPGVHALGNPVTRMLGVARSRVTGRDSAPGIVLSEQPPALGVRVSIVAEYPANVTALADAVRSGVQAALAGVHSGPLDVEVVVSDVHGPFDEPIPEVEPEPEAEVEVEAVAAPESAPASEAASAPVLVAEPAPAPRSEPTAP